jgi:hypothetical protein
MSKLSPILIAQIIQLGKELENGLQYATPESAQTHMKYFIVMLEAVACKVGPNFQAEIDQIKGSLGLAV